MERKTRNWSTAEQLEELLCDLVSWESRTGTQGEIDFPYRFKNKLLELTYFQQNPSHIQFHDAGNNRNAVSALYRSEAKANTIVLLSHFDTVHTEEFGSLGNLAFQPRKLTEKLTNGAEELPEDAQMDLKSGDYLFGRGTMDMKMGIALHLHVLERATLDKWPINLLLLTVPDEERNSVGMRAAVNGIVELKEKFDLNYILFINSEPSFPQSPQDKDYYIYSGTIGKIMPSALFYGISTHAGEPLSGMTGHYMASYLTKAMEFNAGFVEEDFKERTPLPVCLQKTDLKKHYSTQTSHHTAALYNVFMMERNADEIMDLFKNTALLAMKECQADYEAVCKRENIKPIGRINVLQYKELIDYANKKLGNEFVESIRKNVTGKTDLDEREMSIQICDQ